MTERGRQEAEDQQLTARFTGPPTAQCTGWSSEAQQL